MEKTATLNLRVSPQVKEDAEKVLSRLGVPMSTAINMYLNQIALTVGIPFPVTIPTAPPLVNADLMDDATLYDKLMRGINDVEAGRVYDAAEVLAHGRGKR